MQRRNQRTKRRKEKKTEPANNDSSTSIRNRSMSLAPYKSWETLDEAARRLLESQNDDEHEIINETIDDAHADEINSSDSDSNKAHPEEEAPVKEINQPYRAENENDDDDYELTPRQKQLKRIRGRKGEGVRCINSRTAQTFPFNSVL